MRRKLMLTAASGMKKRLVAAIYCCVEVRMAQWKFIIAARCFYTATYRGDAMTPHRATR